jgi:hypothetical protein
MVSLQPAAYSRTFSLFHALVYGVRVTIMDAKSLTLEGVSEIIPNLSMSMSDVVHCQLPRSRLALPVPGSNSVMNC